MCEKLNCMNCCIADFKYVLCDCDNGIYKEYKKIGSAEDFENEVLNRTKRKTGKWMPLFDGRFTGGAHWFRCSKCERVVPDVRNGGWNFCPNCGARMDAE